jgi:hypothetical protein
MDTVVIYSYWGGNPVEKTLDMAFISNYLARKHGYTTVLYVNKENKTNFKDIPYSEVIEMDENILQQLPTTVWSAGKILAASMEKRPFIHVDFDLFILDNQFYNDIKDKDFVTYHCEPWLSKKTFNNSIKYILKKTNNSFGLKYKEDLYSYNFAIFGSCKSENIPIINKECKFVIENLIKNNKILNDQDFVESIRKNFPNIPEAVIPVIIEQVITSKLIRLNFKNTYEILKISDSRDSYEAGLKIGLLHLWGSKNYNNILQKIKNKKINLIKEKGS